MPEENLPNQDFQKPVEPIAPQSQPFVNNQKPPHKFPILKFIALGILFIIGLSLIAAAYFMGMNNSKSKNLTQTLSPSPSPTSINSDETSDWKTYEGENYSFKYPSNFSISDKKEPNELARLIPPPDPSCLKCGGGTAMISVSIIDNPNSLPLSIFFEQNGNKVGYVGDYKKNFIKLNLPNIKEGMINPKAFGAGAINENAFINFGDKIIVLDCGEICNDNELFIKILSTFKFTDASDSSNTSNWKDYTHPNLKYSLKYPATWNGKTETIPTNIKGQFSSFIARTSDYNAEYALNNGAELNVFAEETNETDIQILFENSLGAEIAENKKNTRVDGVNAIQYNFSYEGNIATMTELIKDNVHYTIKYRYVNENDKNKYLSSYQYLLDSFNFN